MHSAHSGTGGQPVRFAACRQLAKRPYPLPFYLVCRFYLLGTCADLQDLAAAFHLQISSSARPSCRITLSLRKFEFSLIHMTNQSARLARFYIFGFAPPKKLPNRRGAPVVAAVVPTACSSAGPWQEIPKRALTIAKDLRVSGKKFPFSFRCAVCTLEGTRLDRVVQ